MQYSPWLLVPKHNTRVYIIAFDRYLAWSSAILVFWIIYALPLIFQGKFYSGSLRVLSLLVKGLLFYICYAIVLTISLLQMTGSCEVQ